MKKNNSKKDERVLAALMNEYSVSDIITILSEVDEKIIELHKCSSDDFLKLNNHFKSYFSDSKILSNNAKQIIGIITGKETNNYYKELKDIYSGFEDFVSTLDSKISNIIQALNSISSEINNLFIPIKNFRQNLMTIRFLFTNLELGESLSNKKTHVLSEKDAKKIEVLIEKTKKNYDTLDRNLNTIKKDIQKSILKISDIKGNNIKNIKSFLDQINSSISLLSNKYDEAKSKTPVLSNKTNNTSKSIAKIITDLQYQDIIRQKIEHIQQSHKNIIKELSILEMVNDQNTVVHNKLKTFIQLRDIAGLQSAQLIHANKQYQEAIESITGMFREIGENMNSISSICMELSTPEQSSNSSLYKDILNNLSNGVKITEKLSADNKNFYSELEFINNGTNNITSQFNITKDVDKELDETILNIIDQLNEKNNNNEIVQINTLYNDIQHYAKDTSTIINKFIELSDDLQEYIQKLKNDDKTIEGNKDFKSSVNNVIEGTQENGKKVNAFLQQNRIISNKVSNEVKNAIKEVRYYDFFEKVIEDIINQLNTINYKLKTSQPEQDDDKVKNLDQIKKLYTMNSEHVIHEKIATSDNNITIDLFEDDNLNTNEEDDDNLELF